MIKVEFNEMKSEKILTGHCWKNSTAETCNSCGNCDGARCDSCEESINLYNSVTNESIPIYIDCYINNSKYEGILKQLTDTEDYHYGYYMIDFKYDSIKDSDDKKLYDMLNNDFIQIHGIDDKDKKVITYHILLSFDDFSIEDFINDKLEKLGIKSFEIIKIISNKIQ